MRLRHGLLLVGAVLRVNPLGPGVSVQLSIDVEVVEDAGVIQCSDLDNPLAWEAGALAPHSGTTVAATEVSILSPRYLPDVHTRSWK